MPPTLTFSLSLLTPLSETRKSSIPLNLSWTAVFQKDDLEFKEFVDQVLADRFKSGVMQRLYGQWFQQPIPALRSMNVNMSMNVQTKAVFDSPNDRP